MVQKVSDINICGGKVSLQTSLNSDDPRPGSLQYNNHRDWPWFIIQKLQYYQCNSPRDKWYDNQSNLEYSTI